MNFLGEPKFEKIKDTELLFAVNTNWGSNPASSIYYLLNEDSWLTTKDVKKGPWTAAKTLPDGFKKLPDDENWQDVRKNIPGKPAKVVPTIFVYTTPAESSLPAELRNSNRSPERNCYPSVIPIAICSCSPVRRNSILPADSRTVV